MSEPIYEGTTVQVKGTFVDHDGQATDPSAAQLEVQDPNGVITTPTLSNPSTGVYTGLQAVAVPGLWRFRWEGSGALVAADEGYFYVRPTAIT